MWVNEYLFVCITYSKAYVDIHNWENVCSIHTDDDIKRQDRSCRFFLYCGMSLFFYGCVSPFGFAYILPAFTFSHTLAHIRKNKHKRMENRLMFLLFIRLISPFRVENAVGLFPFMPWKTFTNSTNRQPRRSSKKRKKKNQQRTTKHSFLCLEIHVTMSWLVNLSYECNII